MAVTSQDIINEAIQIIGDDQPFVTGQAPNFDNSAAGKVASKIYASVVATVARQFAWSFARTTAALSLTGNTAPFPWAYEYLYPAGCVQVWQLAPASLADPNNPLPINWARGIALVSSVQSSVIWTNQASAHAIFNGNPAESTWDSLFRQTVVRMLASELAMGVAGKPDASQMALESAGAFSKLGEGRES